MDEKRSQGDKNISKIPTPVERRDEGPISSINLRLRGNPALLPEHAVSIRVAVPFRPKTEIECRNKKYPIQDGFVQGFSGGVGFHGADVQGVRAPGARAVRFDAYFLMDLSE